MDTTGLDTTGLDVEYVREVGEDVRARLFPRPKKARNEYGDEVEGPVPFPLPVELLYQPNDTIATKVWFTAERSIQYVTAPGTPAPDVSPTKVRVVFDGNAPLVVDLEFGERPELTEEMFFSSMEYDALVALLRAITGTL